MFGRIEDQYMRRREEEPDDVERDVFALADELRVRRKEEDLFDEPPSRAAFLIPKRRVL